MTAPHPQPDRHRELAVACALAREAGAAIEAIRAEGFEARTKSDSSPVTRADLASDRLIRAGLRAAFPLDGVLSEETPGSLRGVSGRTWIVDPLDGTRGFVDGLDEYAVQIAMVDGGEPVLGVVYEPRSRRLFRATRGTGCWLERPDTPPAALSVSAHADPGQMAVVVSHRMAAPEVTRLVAALGAPRAAACHSVGVKVGLLARRAADVYVSNHAVSLWDSAAPLVVLAEAGGQLTLASGEALTYPVGCDHVSVDHPGPIVASNGTRHAAVCAAARRALGW